jgi:AcrR family transcriptional regulator
MQRDEVARHQRARLYGAMIEAISLRGYGSTTVAHVIGLAGVSRRAFYEQFSNKEECFLATYDIAVARTRKLAMDAWAGERGWANRLHASCKAMLDDAAESPKGPRLVLVDSLGIGPKGRERLQLACMTFERLVHAGFKAAPDGTRLPPLMTRTIVGGARHVMFTRLRNGREKELLTLTDELLDWVESYRSPVAGRLSSLGLTQPPHVPPTPAAFLSNEDKRSRVLGSVVHLTLDEGYAGLTDPQIAQFAGISTEAFHKQFANKEECFLTVLDEFVQEALCSVRTAMARATSWPEAVYLAMDAFVEYFVAHQALLRMAFIDVFEVGPGMIDRMTKSIEDFIELVLQSAPAPRRGPALAAEAVTGAIWGIVSSYAANDRLRYLPCLVDHLSFVILAPYLGPKTAIEGLEEAHKRPHLTLVT